LGRLLIDQTIFAGSLMQLAGGPIAYKAKYQPTVAGSSTEAEFCQASDTGRMALYVRSILWDLNVPQEAATILYEDNDGATAMANAGKPTPRSRHIDIKFYALQEWVERDLMVLEQIDTSLNMADGLTKPLVHILFYHHCNFTMGFVPPVYSPKYKEVAKIYTVPDSTTMTVGSKYKSLVAAAAAKTTASWSKVVQSMYLMPLSFVRSDSSLSPERGGGLQIHTTYQYLADLVYRLLTQ
jgi:hypothetical protein